MFRNRAAYSVGCDVWLPAVSKAKGVYDDVVMCDARFLPFRSRSFDTVFAIEVVEHLFLNDAVELVHEMERIARYSIIITTPVLPPSEKVETWIYTTDARAPHFSWIPSNILRSLGYRVRGLNPRTKSKHLGTLLKPFTYLIYRCARSLLAIKLVKR